VPLPPPDVPREHIHSRNITLRGYRRTDGLYDIEGRLQDLRPMEVKMPRGMLPAGEPIHDMWLRLTIDLQGHIVAAVASTDASPFGASCASINPDYGKLVGVRIGPGFRAKVRSLFGGLAGCTHLTELLMTMGTAAIQSLAGHVPEPEDVRPFSLDGCHALDSSGPVVKEFHPRWYRPKDGAA
jgi:hypothetical protein